MRNKSDTFADEFYKHPVAYCLAVGVGVILLLATLACVLEPPEQRRAREQREADRIQQQWIEMKVKERDEAEEAAQQAIRDEIEIERARRNR